MPKVTRTSTKARRRKESLSRRDSILLAATGSFLADGYQRATTERIAAEAGVSVGTLYNVYGSKEVLYLAVAAGIGREVVSYLEDTVLPIADAGVAIEQVVRFRLAHAERQRLFFVLFSSEGTLGGYPELTGAGIVELYEAYLGLVGEVFARGMQRGRLERLGDPFHLALILEGIINAFAAQRTLRGVGDPMMVPVSCVVETCLKMVLLKRAAVDGVAVEQGVRSREIFVTSLDMARLTELIAVARAFGNTENAAHLTVLETELNHCRVVEPAAVPHGTITMNSRFSLRHLPSGEHAVATLVFPVDAGNDASSLSILSRLGTALLGRRVGDLIEVAEAGRVTRCEIIELLYQPEAAGDFHR